ncbi:MAG TPA: peptidylprolyl isomerase [Gemmataceae bacterium]|nr:peptidylprolyl isomerase [Gemmataceae bacterium]
MLRGIRWFGCVCVLGLIVAGCKKAEDAPKKEEPKAIIPPAKRDNNGKPVPARVVARTKAPTLLPFKDAVILGDNAPVGVKPPPDVTVTGKSTAKLYEKIAKEWDTVSFTDNDGKPIRYKAIIATDLGDVHLDLLGDSAPNHVRSFVCLAKAGYFDGLSFYYSMNRLVDGSQVSFIEAGCPLNLGDEGNGSIGYWLRPEIDRRLTHEAGVLGACQASDPNSAACRFYLTAGTIPSYDGTFTIFGRVTQGLDVVRTINRREVQDLDRLRQPVLIRNVTILTAPD